MLKLKCERCGKMFEAAHNRQIVHCKECAEYLRKRGEGPIQLKRKREARNSQ